MSERHEWTDYAASYALDALDSHERTAYEEHLQTCAGCRGEVETYREVAAAIAHATPPLGAPRSLRARVIADARKVRPIRARNVPAAFDETATRPADAAPDAGINAIPARTRRRGTVWLAAAGVVLAIFGVGLYLIEHGRRVGLEDQLARATAAADSTRLETTRLEELLAEREALLSTVIARGTRLLTLSARGQPPSARLYWDRERGRIVVVAADLEAAPAGRTYQLWGIRSGQPISIGTFNTSEQGSTTLALPVDPALSFELSAITEEPAGGSPLPTTTPFLVGNWSAAR